MNANKSPQQTTEPIDVMSRSSVFRHGPRLVLFSGYALSLLILLAAASTWFVPTNVSVPSSGTLSAHVTALRIADAAQVLARSAEPGQMLKAGDPVLNYTTDTQRLAEARLGHELRATLNDLTRDGSTADPQLIAQLQSTLGLLSAEDGSSVALAPAAGRLLAFPPLQAGSPSIIAAGAPLVEVGDDATFHFAATLATDYYPGITVGGPVKVLLSDFGGTDVPGTLLSIKSHTSFEFALKQFAEDELKALRATTQTQVLMGETQLPAQVSVGTQLVAFTLELDPLPAAARHAIKARRNAAFTHAGHQLKAKWGSISSVVEIELPGPALSPQARAAVQAMLVRGERSLSVASSWVQTDTRKLFWRLFGS